MRRGSRSRGVYPTQDTYTLTIVYVPCLLHAIEVIQTDSIHIQNPHTADTNSVMIPTIAF